jgi:hypothetical protein
MKVDPRLADVTLLALAAKRRLAMRPAAWEQTEGLCTLLEAARHLPKRGPWAMPDLESDTGMGKLLREARQGQEEHRHGA